MPVRVMWNFSARFVIEASARPSCSSTLRRVASEKWQPPAFALPNIVYDNPQRRAWFLSHGPHRWTLSADVFQSLACRSLWYLWASLILAR
jgi:hypothetical protein